MVTKSDPKDSLRNKWAKVHAHRAIIDTWNKQVKDYNEKTKLGLKPPGPMEGIILTPLHKRIFRWNCHRLQTSGRLSNLQQERLALTLLPT